MPGCTVVCLSFTQKRRLFKQQSDREAQLPPAPGLEQAGLRKASLPVAEGWKKMSSRLEVTASPGWAEEAEEPPGKHRVLAGCLAVLCHAAHTRYQSLAVIATAGASDRLWFPESFDHATSAGGNAWFPLFRLTSLSSLSSS